MATKLIGNLAVFIESLLPHEGGKDGDDSADGGADKNPDNMSDIYLEGHQSSSDTSGNAELGSSTATAATLDIEGESSALLGGKGVGVDSSHSKAVLGKQSKEASREMLIKVVNIALFNQSVVDKFLPEPFPTIASSPHISAGVIAVIYLIFAILYFPLHICGLILTPVCSIIMFLIGLNYLARKVGSAMSYMGSSQQFQQDMSKDYLRRAIIVKLGNVSGTIAQFTTSVILVLNGKIHRTEMGKIYQSSRNLAAYANILQDYGQHVSYGSDELFRNGLLSPGDGDVFKQLSASLSALATASLDFEPLVRRYFEATMAPSTSPTKQQNSPQTNSKALVNCAGRVMQQISILESILKSMLPTKVDADDSGPMQLVSKAWSFLTSDCAALGICGSGNTIANSWKYEKLSFPLIRSILFNKYRFVRLNVRGCSGNKIDGVIIPSKFDLSELRPVIEEDTSPTNVGSAPATKKRSNSTVSNGISNKFTASHKGMVLFCCPNAGFYENLEDMITSGYENCWFHFYNQTLEYDFCTFNYRGYNLSEGSPRYPEEIKNDALILARHLIEKYRVKKLVVHGESIGGLVATYIAAELSKSDGFNEVSVGVSVAGNLKGGSGPSAVATSTSSPPLHPSPPVLHGLVCDRTFTSLDSVASRLILNKNILGRCLRLLARWDTSTISNYLECKSSRKVILQDPVDEIIAYPASLLVGVSARLGFQSSASVSHINPNSSVSSISYKLFHKVGGSLQTICRCVNPLGLYGLSSYNYFQSIKYLSNQYNINYFCGFDLPYRDEEDYMLLSLKNNLHDLKLNDKFIDHFTACLRHIFVCARYEAAVARVSGFLSSSPSFSFSNFRGNADDLSGLPGGSSPREKHDVGFTPSHPNTDWIRNFCRTNISCDSNLSSPSSSSSSSYSNSNSNLNNHFNPVASNTSVNGVGVFNKAWVAVARVHGGFGQLLGQSLKTSPMSFISVVKDIEGDVDGYSQNGSHNSNSNSNSSNQEGHSRTSSKGTAPSDDLSDDDNSYNLDNDDDDDDSTVEEVNDIEQAVGELAGVDTSISSSRSPKDSQAGDVGSSLMKNKRSFFHGREKDSVATWLASVLAFGNSSCRTGSTASKPSSSSASNSTFLDHNMPPEVRNIDDALVDLDGLMSTLKSFYQLSLDSSGSRQPLTDNFSGGLDASSGDSGMSDYKRKLFQLYKKTIAVSRQRRRALQLGTVNANNYNIKPGFWCPVVDSCLESVKFVRNSLAVVRDYHIHCTALGGDNNYSSISVNGSDGNNTKTTQGDCISNSSSSSSGGGSIGAGGSSSIISSVLGDNSSSYTTSASDDALPPSVSSSSSTSSTAASSISSSITSMCAFTKGRLIPLHTGHSGWPSEGNLSDLASVLAS